MRNIALHLLDLTENSVRAKATKIFISIREERNKERLILTIEDNGEGMDEDKRSRAMDPFYTSRTTRNVGMGLPLFRSNAERTGGSLRLESSPAKGTLLQAEFVSSHPDMLPAGEIEDVLVLLAVGHPEIALVYEHTTENGQYRFETEAIREIVGDLSESTGEVRRFLKEMIAENLKAIGAGDER